MAVFQTVAHRSVCVQYFQWKICEQRFYAPSAPSRVDLGVLDPVCGVSWLPTLTQGAG